MAKQTFTWGEPNPCPLPRYEAECLLFLSRDQRQFVLEKATHFPPHLRETFFYITWLALQDVLLGREEEDAPAAG